MKIDTTKVPGYILREIAANLGWEDEGEIPQEYLRQIADMTPEEAVGRIATWRLGSAEWGRFFITAIDTLRAAGKEAK